MALTVLAVVGVAAQPATQGRRPAPEALTARSEPGRFTTLPNFAVERVVPAGKTDSYVTMTFDSQGRLVVSKEQDHPRRLVDADGDGVFEGEVVVSTRVKNCQGLWYDGPTLYGCVQPRRAGGTAGARREVRPLPDAGRRRRRRHRGRDADRAVHRRRPGARRPRAAPRPGRRADDDDRQQHVLRRRDADRSGVAVRRRPRVAVPAGDPGRPRLRPEREDWRARHGAPRRSRDEALHDRSPAPSATPTTTPSISRASCSRSTATWSGTSGCRGTATSARCTSCPAATTATATDPASCRPGPTTACRRCATSAADRRSGSSSTSRGSTRRRCTTRCSKPTGRAAACSTRR